VRAFLPGHVHRDVACLSTFVANQPGSAMKWFLTAIAALLSILLAVSIVGIVMDPGQLDFWTEALMWCLLAIVVVVPAALFFTTRSPRSNSPRSNTTSEAGNERRSVMRSFAYVFSVVVVGWTAISMVSLFTDAEHLNFWTQSVLWSLLVLVVWAPVMTFLVNPFQDPALRSPLGPPDSITPSQEESHPSFVDDEAATFVSPPGALSEADTREPDLEDASDDEEEGWPYV